MEALAGQTSLYVLVSSCSVYADHSTPGRDEESALLVPLQRDVMQTMESYGEAKVACEHYVLRGMGRDRALIACVGLIGGPGDISDRSGYWPLRFARPASEDGAVLRLWGHGGSGRSRAGHGGHSNPARPTAEYRRDDVGLHHRT